MRRKKVDILKEMQYFGDIKVRWLAQLATVDKQSSNDIKTIAEIVKIGGSEDLWSAVAFLNGFCAHSPKRFNLLKWKFKTEGLEEVFGMLIKHGLIDMNAEPKVDKEKASLIVAMREVKRAVEEVEKNPMIKMFLD